MFINKKINVAVRFIWSQHRDIPEILCHCGLFYELLGQKEEAPDTFWVRVVGGMIQTDTG